MSNPTDNIRKIFIATCQELVGMDVFAAKDLKYGKEIYPSPGVQWYNGSAPLELQVVDSGEQTLDRDGSVRRATINVSVAILMRRPSQYEGQFATILMELNDDLQTYARNVRATLDGDFLNYTDTIGVDSANLLVRPLVYMGASGIQTNPDFPDLMVKELKFIGGINDEL